MSVAWVTGAHGFIGRHLAHHLAGAGWRVFGIGHGAWPEREARRWGIAGWVNGALEAGNLELLQRLGGPPDGVWHLAGGSAVAPSFAAPFEDFSRTVAAAARLFDWLRQSAPAASVLAVSSAAVYGAGHDGPIAVDAPLHAYSPYGHHKLMLEQLCHLYAASFGLRSVVVRLFSAYGPGLRKQLLWDACSRLAAGEPVLRLGGTGQEVRDWTEVSDVVRLLAAAVAMASSPATIINGGSGIPTTVAGIAAALVDAWGARVPVEFTGAARPGDPASLLSGPCVVGGTPFQWTVPVASGIPRYVEWFRGATG